MAFVSRTAHWYKAIEGLVPIRWVFLHDLEGTHEDRLDEHHFFGRIAARGLKKLPRKLRETVLDHLAPAA